MNREGLYKEMCLCVCVRVFFIPRVKVYAPKIFKLCWNPLSW